MFFDLWHFGDGPQAINYFILCLFAILGTIQFVAIRYNRRDLQWVDGQVGVALSGTIIVGSFIWFFATDKEIFIPGLAGGELFTLFVVAFVVAVPVTRALAWLGHCAARPEQSVSKVEGLRQSHVASQKQFERLLRFARNDNTTKRKKEPTI